MTERLGSTVFIESIALGSINEIVTSELIEFSPKLSFYQKKPKKFYVQFVYG